MPLNLGMPDQTSPELKPRITVIGVGGAGGNAVNNMIRSNLQGVEFIACNTDAQALTHNLAERRFQLGQAVTRGLGAGSRPDVGRAAADETITELMEHLAGANMVFITAGMGGGTGTGAAPVIARAARESGILTVGVVTKPFTFEGAHRMRLAEAGILELQQFVDTLIVIPNQNLFRLANERTTFADAFKMADEVLHAGVRGVTDLMVMPGLINLDFADIRAVMSEMGKAMMGTGDGAGERRALDAAEAAISNPLLEDTSMKGARGVLINITGGFDMTLFEVDEAANRIRDEVDPDANIIFGSTFDETMEGRMRVSVVATGIESVVSSHEGPRRSHHMIPPAGADQIIAPIAAHAPMQPQAPIALQPAPIAPAPLAPAGGMMPRGVGAAVGTPLSQPQRLNPVAPPRQITPNHIPAHTMSAGDQHTVGAHHQMGMAEPLMTNGNTALKPEEAISTQPMAAAVPMPTITEAAAPPSLTVDMSDHPTDAPFVPRAPVIPGQPAQSRQPQLDIPHTQPVDPAKSRSPSLFERVTGIRGRGGEPQPAQPATPPAPPAQASMTLTAVPDAPRSQSADDLLEIPAFLRRQAN
ncbi:MAG: cell division protein FtsZ [Alphaproteobacteria bacterium]|nr:MAG: cell division protein FtsZ [Alphaproteobacteria bacterium]